ncbi:hypothetical protein ACHQM5_001642 [Ranunculus cassubicifolius]
MATELEAVPLLSKLKSPVILASLVLLALLVQIFLFSPISSPQVLQLPPLEIVSRPAYPWNNELQKVTKLGERILTKPEDVVIDENGLLYTATRDGWIKMMHKNGSWENWKYLATDSMLGITTSSTPGYFIVCDASLGLLKVSKEETIVLASEVDGKKIMFADVAIEASDGSVYFSDPSTKFGFHDWFLDVLEARPRGRLLKYDPLTKKAVVLFDDLGFANGVALSKDEDFLLVCESWKYRCLKYHLKGENKGKLEVFIENLPGAPDNIKLAPDGTFWVGLIELRLWGIPFAYTSTVTKHFLAAFPKLVELMQLIRKNAMVANVGSDGKIIKKFDDSNGKVTSFVTSVLEFEYHIYMGSLLNNFIGKLRLR